MTSRYEVHIHTNAGGSGPPPPGSMDRFAPKYLVGNVPAGDDPVAYSLGGFYYIPDPGDGSGIALALTQFGGPGDVWIRPGTYDLNAGGVLAALAIPAGVRVQGAGMTTGIIGRVTGDQGIFTMASNTSLIDMNLVVNASDAGSVTSVAVVDVLSTTAVAIQRVGITFATDPAGALRYGIRFAGGGLFLGGAADVNDVYVTATTTTGLANPTACYAWALAGFVSGMNVWGTGGDVGLYSPSSSGIAVITTLILLNWTERAIWWSGSGGGAVRIDQSALIANPAATSPTVILLEASGGHVLRSVSVQGNSTLGSRGIVLDSPLGTSFNSVEIVDCEVSGVMEGIILGGALTAVDDVTVADCTLFVGTGLLATHRGVAVLNTTSRRCHIRGTTIQVVSPLGAAAEALVVEGERHEITGNTVDQSSFGTSAAVELRCSRSIFESNTIASQDQFGVRLTAGTIRNTISGNEIEVNTTIAGGACILVPDTASRHAIGDNVLTQTNPAVPQTAVRCDGTLCTIGDNTIEVVLSQPVSPGIALGLTSANNTCVANVCSGSPATPVSDAGSGNEVAHNVGV